MSFFECHSVKCHSADCHLSEFHFVKCHSADCLLSEFHFVKCQSAEYHLTECLILSVILLNDISAEFESDEYYAECHYAYGCCCCSKYYAE